jgi:chromosome segregation and condensation protein ScpB
LGSKEKAVAEVVLRALPSGVSRETLAQLLDDQHGQEELLETVIRRFERRYDESSVELEGRLDRGEGQEHPDWEDSIEWRNAVESLRRAQMMRQVLEWLLGSISPSTLS